VIHFRKILPFGKMMAPSPCQPPLVDGRRFHYANQPSSKCRTWTLRGVAAASFRA